jgi:hypothetical protein
LNDRLAESATSTTVDATLANSNHFISFASPTLPETVDCSMHHSGADATSGAGSSTGGVHKVLPAAPKY